MRFRLGRRRWVAAVVVAMGLVAAGVAYATIPDSNQVYTACMLKRVGTIRLIDPSLPASNLMSHCTALETKVQFGEQGPPGLAGAPGPAGPQGPAGTSTSAMSSAAIGPGSTETLITVPGKFSVSFNDCVDVPWSSGSYGSHLIFTALGGDEILVNGQPVTSDGTPSFVPLLIDQSGTPYSLEDWTTRETWVIHVRADQHSGSVADGNLQCNVRAFAQTTAPRSSTDRGSGTPQWCAARRAAARAATSMRTADTTGSGMPSTGGRSKEAPR